MKLVQCLVLFLIVFETTNGRPESESGESKDRYLSLPKLDKCNSRTKEIQFKGQNFFYSGNDPELKDKKYDWLDARNACRDRCMETISFENQEKFDFFKTYIENNNISFIWTSGRLCDFAGCEGRWDLLPKRIKGWLWSGITTAIPPTNKIPPEWDYQPWSFTGEKKKPQPDNAEFYLSQTSESCLGILNNMYNDSVAWHDIACYHRARFICEDSDILLKEVHEQKDVEEEEEDSVGALSVTSTTKTRRVSTSTKTARPVKTTKSTTLTSTTTTVTESPTEVFNANQMSTEPSTATTAEHKIRKVIRRKKIKKTGITEQKENSIQSESSEKQSSRSGGSSKESDEVRDNHGHLATKSSSEERKQGNKKTFAPTDVVSSGEEKLEDNDDEVEVEVTTIADIPSTTRRSSRGRGGRGGRGGVIRSRFNR